MSTLQISLGVAGGGGGKAEAAGTGLFHVAVHPGRMGAGTPPVMGSAAHLSHSSTE
jgi:hypothetical protein